MDDVAGQDLQAEECPDLKCCIDIWTTEFLQYFAFSSSPAPAVSCVSISDNYRFFIHLQLHQTLFLFLSNPIPISLHLGLATLLSRDLYCLPPSYRLCLPSPYPFFCILYLLYCCVFMMKDHWPLTITLFLYLHLLLTSWIFLVFYFGFFSGICGISLFEFQTWFDAIHNLIFSGQLMEDKLHCSNSLNSIR